MVAVKVGVVGILVQRSILGYFVRVWLHIKLRDVGVRSAGLSQSLVSRVDFVCELAERIVY